MRALSPPRALFGADENAFDTRTLIRLCAWCVGALAALCIAIVVGRSELGSQRAHSALVTMVSPPAGTEQQLSEQMTAWATSFDKQMHRQSEVIGALAEERNTLGTKVDAMERAIGNLNSTLARTADRLDMDVKAAQQTAAAAVIAAKVAQARAEVPESPSIGTPATLPASRVPFPPVREAARENSLVREVPREVPPVPAPTQIHPMPPAPTGAVPMPTDTNGPPGMMKPFPVQAPPPAAVEPPAPATPPRPKPAAKTAPDRTASHFHAPLLQSNPLMTTGILDAPIEPGPLSVEFAVDLGPATTVEAMRTRWSELKASQSPLFDSLRPLVSLKDDGKSGQELHLIAGPLSNSAASARFCAVLSGTGIPCQATVYEGQHLAAR